MIFVSIIFIHLFCNLLFIYFFIFIFLLIYLLFFFINLFTFFFLLIYLLFFFFFFNQQLSKNIESRVDALLFCFDFLVLTKFCVITELILNAYIMNASTPTTIYHTKVSSYSPPCFEVIQMSSLQ